MLEHYKKKFEEHELKKLHEFSESFNNQGHMRDRLVDIIRRREMSLKKVSEEMPITPSTLKIFVEGGKVKIKLFSKIEKYVQINEMLLEQKELLNKKVMK